MEPEHKLIAARREKLENLKSLGVRPYGDPFPVDGAVDRAGF